MTSLEQLLVRSVSALLISGALSSCAILSTEVGVTLASEPPGATVLVDGQDSGFVTPIRMGLTSGRDYEISFALDGYEPATRLIGPKNRREYVYWRDAEVRASTWRFPLWLNGRDFFIPVKWKRGLGPSRVFVRMQRGVQP